MPRPSIKRAPSLSAVNVNTSHLMAGSSFRIYQPILDALLPKKLPEMGGEMAALAFKLMRLCALLLLIIEACNVQYI